MPQPKKILPSSFALGLDAGGSDPHVVEGKLLKAENGQMDRAGVWSRRRGLRAVTGSVTSGSTIHSHEAEGVALIQNSAGWKVLYGSGSSASISDHPDSDARIVDAKSRRIKLDSGTYAYSWCECVCNDSYILLSAFGAGYPAGSLTRHDVYYVYVLDVETYETVDSDALAVAHTTPPLYPRVVKTADDTLAVVRFNDLSTNVFSIKKIGTDGSIPGTWTTITTTHEPSDAQFDVCSAGYEDKIAIGYAKLSTNDAVGVVYDVDAGSVVSEYTDSSITGADSVCVFNFTSAAGSSGFYCMAYYDDTAGNLYVNPINPVSGASLGRGVDTSVPTIWNMAGVSTGDGVGLIVYSVAGEAGPKPPEIEAASYSSSGGSTTVTSSDWTNGEHAILTSKPIYDDRGDLYYTGFFQGGSWYDSSPTTLSKISPQKTNLLFCNTAQKEFCGAFLNNKSGYALAGVPDPTHKFNDLYGTPSVAKKQDGTILVAALEQLSTDNSNVSIVLCEINTSPNVFSVEANGELVFPGANALAVGTTYLEDSAPASYPEIGSCAATGATGTWSRTGRVGVCAVWRDKSADGIVRYSSPSPFVYADLAATNNQITTKVPSSSFGNRNHRELLLFRTDIDGSIYYLSNKDYRTTPFSNRYYSTASIGTEILNDSTYFDIVPVTEVLYTSGGVLEVIAPPPHLVATVFQNRYFLVPRDEEDTTILYSREMVRGRGIPHTDVLRVKLSQSGGRTTAMREFDDMLLIFKGSKVFAMHGVGPDNTGAGAGYSRPRVINEAIGCKDQRTVAEIPQGCAFLSRHGIYLLDHKLQPQPLGADVRYYTDTYTYDSVAVVPDDHIVVWGSSNGPALVYDYLHGVWSTWTGNFDSVDGLCVVDNVLYVLKGTSVYYLSDTNYADEGTTFQLKLATGWYQLNGQGGVDKYHSAIVHGYALGDTTVTGKVAYDLVPRWQYEKTFKTSGLQQFAHTENYGDGLTSDDYIGQAMALELGGNRQEMFAVRFEISDSNSSSQTIDVSGLSLVVAPKERSAYLGKNRKFS